MKAKGDSGKFTGEGLDGIIDRLQDQGWTVRYYGSFPAGLAYQVANRESSAIRYDHQLRAVLDGRDSYLSH